MSAKTQPLPRLLSAKDLAAELGISQYAAEQMMGKVGAVTIGRRHYVSEEAVRDYLSRAAKS